MNLSTPISTLFHSPENAKKIIQASDCLECRDMSLYFNGPKQWVYHSEHDLGHPWNDDIHEKLKKIISDRSELRLATFHISSSCSEPRFDGVMCQFGGRAYSVCDLKRHIEENLRWFRHQFEGRPLMVGIENNNYFPTKAYDFITDSEYLYDIVHTMNLFFLFDMAHARITAHNRSIDYEEYFRKLPMGRLIQIHISQFSIKPDGLAYDTHQVPGSDMYEDVKSLCERYQPQYLTIEYYKDVDQLISLLKQYRELCSRQEG